MRAGEISDDDVQSDNFKRPGIFNRTTGTGSAAALELTRKARKAAAASHHTGSQQSSAPDPIWRHRRPTWLSLSFYCRHLGRLISTWPARFSKMKEFFALQFSSRRLAFMGATLALLAIGIYGSTQLEVDFDFQALEVETGSAKYKYMQVEDQFFPPLWPASICMGKLDYNAQMDKITNLVKKLDQLDHVELPFEETWVAALPPNASLYDFVTSPAGRPFAMFFNISEEEKEVVASKIDLQFAKPQPISEGAALVEKVETLVEDQVLHQKT